MDTSSELVADGTPTEIDVLMKLSTLLAVVKLVDVTGVLVKLSLSDEAEASVEVSEVVVNAGLTAALVLDEESEIVFDDGIIELRSLTVADASLMLVVSITLLLVVISAVSVRRAAFVDEFTSPGWVTEKLEETLVLISIREPAVGDVMNEDITLALVAGMVSMVDSTLLIDPLVVLAWPSSDDIVALVIPGLTLQRAQYCFAKCLSCLSRLWSLETTLKYSMVPLLMMSLRKNR